MSSPSRESDQSNETTFTIHRKSSPTNTNLTTNITNKSQDVKSADNNSINTPFNPSNINMNTTNTNTSSTRRTPTLPNSDRSPKHINNKTLVNIIENSASEINSNLPLFDTHSTTPHPSINCKSTNSISTPSIIPAKSNLPFGSLFTPVKSSSTIRFYFNNINGVRPYHDWTRLKAAVHTLSEFKVDIFGAAETNLDWTPQSKQIARNMCQSVYKNATITTSSSNDHGKTEYQPGGTLTVVTGKWTGRCSHQVTDKSGMGRWSGQVLQKSDNQLLYVVTAYRPVEVSSVTDSHTFYHQNWTILRNTGHQDPNPPKQFYLDLSAEVDNWQSQGHEVIIMLDANEALVDNKYLLKFMAKHHLVSFIHPIPDAPATYNRGSQCIDYIIGSQRLLSSVTASGYLPFYEGGVAHI
jgi:hypothetical protein